MGGRTSLRPSVTCESWRSPVTFPTRCRAAIGP